MNATFTFHVRAGTITKGDTPFASGVWSGHGAGRNNPLLQGSKGVGPLPSGLYTYGPIQPGGHLGPDVMRLTMIHGDPLDRDDFYIHGAALVNPAMSSDGCIILDRIHRRAMDEQPSAARTIMVVG